ncbi:MAG: threonylcarbamoyl-AMP synthase [Lachnospiraceae bacterium]|nr:threonylcarbamoyl-AMP synthase [Lachnospiraceae bacterium]
MDTEIFLIATDNIDNCGADLDKAASYIKEGGLVAFPTETVYGLGGNGLLANASKKIYEAKGRPSDNPLILHIADAKAVDELTDYVPDMAKKLIDAFWPGPMTLIFKKSDIVPYETTGGLDTVAIRYPMHPIALELIRRSGCYIAAPSANLSGRPSPTKAEHVITDLDGRVDAIIDGGDVDIGIESTIIDLTGDRPVILRPGFITEDMIKSVLGDVCFDPAVLLDHADSSIVAKAPGMKYKHYAPKAELSLIEGDDLAVLAGFLKMIKEAKNKGLKVGVIVTKEHEDAIDADAKIVLGSKNDLKSIAHNLFASLREMDDFGVDVIYCESFSNEELGRAIMNRLLKAAGYNLISAE